MKYVKIKKNKAALWNFSLIEKHGPDGIQLS